VAKACAGLKKSVQEVDLYSHSNVSKKNRRGIEQANNKKGRTIQEVRGEKLENNRGGKGGGPAHLDQTKERHKILLWE